MEHKKLNEKFQLSKQDLQYSASTLSRVEIEMEKVKQDLQQSQIKLERAGQSSRVNESELNRLEQVLIVFVVLFIFCNIIDGRKFTKTLIVRKLRRGRTNTASPSRT